MVLQPCHSNFWVNGGKKKNWLTLLVKWLQTTDEIKNSAKIMRD